MKGIKVFSSVLICILLGVTISFIVFNSFMGCGAWGNGYCFSVHEFKYIFDQDS
jgi:hypothetical protein